MSAFGRMTIPFISHSLLDINYLICLGPYKEKKPKQKTMNDLVYVMVNSRLTKQRVEMKRRELTIDDFQDDDDWWYVPEEETVVVNQMVLDLDAELIGTGNTSGTSSTSATNVDEFDVSEDIEDSDNGNAW